MGARSAATRSTRRETAATNAWSPTSATGSEAGSKGAKGRMSVSNVGFPAVVVLAAALLAVLMVSSAGEAQGKGVRDVTAMSYNIHHGVGADGRLNLDRIAGVVRAEKAEVVGLQEVDRLWRRSDFVDQVEYLAPRARHAGRLWGEPR